MVLLTFMAIGALPAISVLVSLSYQAMAMLISTLLLGTKAPHPPVVTFLFSVDGKPAPHVTLIAHALITYAALQVVAIITALCILFGWVVLLVFFALKQFVDFWNGGREAPVAEKENKDK